MAQTLNRKFKLSAAARSTARIVSGSSLGLTVNRTHDLIQKVQKGLLFNAFEALASQSGIPPTELVSVLAIPHRTFARRKSSGRFLPDESERLLRIARIFEQALELFEGDASAAAKWLRTPRKALGNRKPLEFSATELGAREVEALMGQLVHGVFP